MVCLKKKSKKSGWFFVIVSDARDTLQSATHKENAKKNGLNLTTKITLKNKMRSAKNCDNRKDSFHGGKCHSRLNFMILKWIFFLIVTFLHFCFSLRTFNVICLLVSLYVFVRTLNSRQACKYSVRCWVTSIQSTHHA